MAALSIGYESHVKLRKQTGNRDPFFTRGNVETIASVSARILTSAAVRNDFFAAA
jgi:hypothetical protein